MLYVVHLPGIEAPRKSKCDYVTLKVHPNLYQKLYSAINIKFLAPIDKKQSQEKQKLGWK